MLYTHPEKGPRLRRISHLLFLCIALAACLPMLAHARDGASAAKGGPFRVLHVMSYHSPWRWTDRQLEGFQNELRNLNVVYKIFQMDTKRNSSIEQKERKAQEAMALIDSWQPDLVYTSDDDAQEYVAKRYVNQKIPFVFSGVNKDPALYGFADGANVAGVLEQEHFLETVKLIRRIVPGAKRIALVFDDATMWGAVRERIRQAMARLPDMQIVADDTLQSFADYRKKMGEYQKTADIVGTVGIFNLKDEYGRNVPYQEVLRWTVDNSRLPDFSFWVDRVYYGTLCSVTVSEREQGRAAGRIARAILAEGKRPSDFKMTPTTKGMPVISLARAKALGIRLDAELLLSAEILPRFEWDQP